MTRDELIEKIAEMATEATDMDSLIECFHNAQVTYLEDADNDELLETASFWDIDTTNVDLF
jgi:hypothetical protein